jgi:hypothetical protein
VLRHRRRHLRVERRHDLLEFFDDRHCQLAADEILGHLEADEAATHHDGPPGAIVAEVAIANFSISPTPYFQFVHFQPLECSVSPSEPLRPR